MEKSISVIIPTINGGDLFQESLEMILAQTINVPLEIIVIDSGSYDQTVQLCAKYPVKLIQIPASSFNHSSTRNLAVSTAQGNICVLTVQDAIPVNRKWLATLVEPLLKNDRVAGVFGQQVSRSDASPLSKCCKLLWYQEWRMDWKQEYEQLPVAPDDWQKLSFEKKKGVARFDNVNSCIRKSVWQEIPFPDVPYAEDFAWAVEALTSGFSIFWQPNAQVFHSHNRSLAYEFRRSYVDMKTFSTILGDCSFSMTQQMARSVIRWLALEALRFLQTPAKHMNDGKLEIDKILQADSMWQLNNREKEILKGSQDSLPPMDSFLGMVYKKNLILRCFYQWLSGPEWFRKMCRKFSNNELFFRNTTVGPPLFWELQGRHRFFFNQLLQIHFAQKSHTLQSVPAIRLGAAAMVGGSLLGQYMSAVKCIERVGEVSERKVQPTSQEQFWQVLDEWYNQDFSKKSEALSHLDQLLTGGV
ncbi:MAG: glycosyltransferase [Proteobacteria bacterium]|nr:glycosyltransferase [Pseudomonadota bacterium]